MTAAGRSLRAVEASPDRPLADRVIPHNLEAERAVLGALLLHAGAFVLTTAIITSTDFYRLAHQQIFRAMERLRARGVEIDIIPLKDDLARVGELDAVGGPAYISALLDGVPHSMNVEHYAGIVKEKATLRDLLKVARGIEADVYEASAGEAAIVAEHALHALSSIGAQQRGRREVIAYSLTDLATTAFPPRRSLLMRNGAPVFKAGDLGQIYAPRGLGKTWFATTIGIVAGSPAAACGFCAIEPCRVLLIDGEMAAEDLQSRFVLLCERLGVRPSDVLLDVVAADWQPDYLPRVDTREGQAAIEPLIDRADFIIFDNRSCLFDSEGEKDASAWQPGQDYLLSLRRRGKAAFVVHHANRMGGARGHSKSEDLLNLSIRLERPADYRQDQGARFTVEFDKARGIYGDPVTPFTTRLTASGWEIEDAPATEDPVEQKLRDYLAAAAAAHERPKSATAAIAGAKVKRQTGLEAWGRLLQGGVIVKGPEGFYLAGAN